MTTVADVISDIVGRDLPIAIRAWDGSRVGPPDAPATVVISSSDALRRILYAPRELGFARAYVVGDIDVEGDIIAAIDLRDQIPAVKLRARHVVSAIKLLGLRNLRPLSPPPVEARRLRGKLHSRARDAQAVSYHYDVSNRFYEMLLGPSMLYTCALFERPEATLEEAQEAKLELVCRKLGLRPGMRVLDLGCGWGSLAVHMASRHGVRVVAVTVANTQVEWAQKRIAETGLGHLVDVRLQDYRDVDDEPFDAVVALGLLEHVGTDLPTYPRRVFELLRPGGRFLHHSITRPRTRKPSRGPTFLSRYVFPDAELHDIGTIIGAIQEAGLEARHMETLREHYVRTLRCWLTNLESNWDAAVGEIGLARARIWRFYIAAGAQGFAANRIQINHVVCVRPDRGRSGMPPRPDW